MPTARGTPAGVSLSLTSASSVGQIKHMPMLVTVAARITPEADFNCEQTTSPAAISPKPILSAVK